MQYQINRVTRLHRTLRTAGEEAIAMIGILFSIGMTLTALGFMITVIGTIMEANKRSKEDRTRRIGGLVMIGPIPIIFGSDSKISKLLVKIAAGLLILYFIFLLILPFLG